MNLKIFFISSFLLLGWGVMFFFLPPSTNAGYRSINQGLYIYHESISPDEDSLAAIMGTFNNPNLGLYLIDLESDAITVLVENDPTLEAVLWVPDGKGLLVLRESSSSNSTHTLHYLSKEGGSEQLLSTYEDNSARLQPQNLISTAEGYAYLYENDIGSYRYQLFMVTLPRGEPVPVTEIEALPEGGVWDYLISPNQKYVVMRYRDDNYPTDSHLILVNLATGEWQILLTLMYGDDEINFKFSPTSRYLVYHHYDARAAKNKLFLYDIETQLSEMIDEQPLTNRFSYDFSPDGNFVLFTDFDGLGSHQLYRYQTSTHERLLLHQSSEQFGDFYTAPNNEHVLIAIRGESSTEFLSVRYNPPAPAFTLVTGFNPNQHLLGESFAFTSDGWLVYRTQGSLTGDWLYGVPLDGGAPPLPLYPDPIVQQFILDPSGTRVYYRILHNNEYVLISEPIIPNKEGPTPLYTIPYQDNGPYMESITMDGKLLFQVYPNKYIADGAPPILYWDSPTTIVGEGENSSVTVVLDSATAVGDITVPIEVIGGTASDGIDYALPSSTLTISQGETAESVTLHVIADGQPENPETIIFQLGNPIGARLGEPRIITVTLYDELFRQVLPFIEK